MANVWIQNTWLHRDGLASEIDVVGPTLQEIPFKSFVSYRLKSIAELEGTGGGIVQERSEDEVGSRGYDNRTVLLGVELPRENIACTWRTCISRSSLRGSILDHR